MTDNHGTLVVIPSLPVYVLSEERVSLTKKFLEGMDSYVSEWGGQVRCILHEVNDHGDNLDNVEVTLRDLSFELVIADFLSDEDMRDNMKGSEFVLLSADYRQYHLSSICNALEIPCAYVTETSLRTQMQILKATIHNPFRLAVRALKYLLQERKLRIAIAKSQGLQANGIPTYEAYKSLVVSPFLYFDNRIEEADVISKLQIKKRLSTLDCQRPLKLAFSGRLVDIKGVDHLLPVCMELDKLKVTYEMHIFGDGALMPTLRKQIKTNKMTERVYLEGVLDFKKELLPMLKNEIDLFVCCHPQGDPSCTYIETLACGTPIIGYANEALEGMLRYANSELGVTVPIHDDRALASMIKLISSDKKRLEEMSGNASRFAIENCFEKTFSSRIKHMVLMARKREGLLDVQ